MIGRTVQESSREKTDFVLVANHPDAANLLGDALVAGQVGIGIVLCESPSSNKGGKDSPKKIEAPNYQDSALTRRQ